MRLRAEFLLLAWLAAPLPGAEQTFAFQVAGNDPGPWPRILAAIGLTPGAGGSSGVYVVRPDAAGSPRQWLQRAEQGALVVVEGESDLAEALGFKAGRQRIAVRNVEDLRRPGLAIIWERGLDLPVFETPARARVFARERWRRSPLMAGFRRGAGAVLWLAVTPGAQGYERFPYLPQALVDLGLAPPLHSARLWSFFDSAYRARVDLDYFARRWRQAGIAALHVAAWHYWEPDAGRDRWLAELIEACHRNAVLVYAWIELPHVSQKFWDDHPEWREKTALGQDAHLDWRRLMNLANPGCERAVLAGVRELARRFDWDGLNLAELYFESLEGAANPARFTPFNDDVRREFRQLRGFDPDQALAGNNPVGLAAFLDYRAALARRLQEKWMGELARLRGPDTDLVVTHVDDRWDTRMRELIGADAARLLPLAARHDFTFLVEDPATIWHFGPERYPQIAARYQRIAPRPEKLAIDINIVERYQDVYPTKQQTGTELFQLVHLASRAFPRVALYVESSILGDDLPLLPSAAAVVERIERVGGKLVVVSPRGVGVAWQGPAAVDGRLWPVLTGGTIWLPAGAHAIEAAAGEPPLRLLDLNGELKTAAVQRDGVEFSYDSTARALAVLDRRPGRVEVDGEEAATRLVENGRGWVLFLPRGQHVVNVTAERSTVAAR